MGQLITIVDGLTNVDPWKSYDVKIAFKMKLDNPMEYVIFSNKSHIPSKETINEYFEKSCGGVIYWDYYEIVEC